MTLLGMFFPLIIILSGILRLSFLSTIEFKEDEAVNLFLAARPLFGHGFAPGATVSSYGILNPPLFLYILFPFILISTNPLFLSGCIAAINSLAVGFFYLVVKRYYTVTSAVFASLLLAISPWAILFSRKIWTQDLVVPLCVILLFSLHNILIDKKTGYWFVYTVTACWMLQMHQATLFFVFLITVLFLAQRPRLHWRAIIVGILVGFLPLIPYLFFDSMHGFSQLSQLMQATNKTSEQMQLLVFMRPFQILNQGNFHFVFGDDIALFATKYSLIYKARLILYAEYGLLVIGGYLFFQREKRLRWLVIMPILLPLLYYFLKIAPEMHYAIPLLPLVALFTGTALSYFWQKTFLLRIITSIGVSLLVIASIGFMVCFYLFLSEQKHLNGDYGTTFAVIDHDVTERLLHYQHNPDYQEMRLAAYIPVDYMAGKSAAALMLYDRERTKQREKVLVQELERRPEDARIRNELLAYFTVPTPTLENIIYLERQKKNDPTYTFFYTKAYEAYLSAHYWKYYDGSDGFRFEYPQHWLLSEEERKITLKGDNYHMTFLPLPTPCTKATCPALLQLPAHAHLSSRTVTIIDQSLTEFVCSEENHVWCGNLYAPLQAKYPYAILLQPEIAEHASLISLEEMTKRRNPLQEILHTIRYN